MLELVIFDQNRYFWNTFRQILEKQLYFLYLKKTSIKRLWNALLVLSSYYVSRILNKPIQWGLPICLSVEPTTACNLKCPQCPSGLKSFSRPTGNLKLEKYYQWLLPVKDKIWGINFYFQGEPFIYPEIHKAISFANEAGIFTMTSTNGHFLDEEQCRKIIESGLDQLTISMDGIEQEVYEKYRIGGSLSKVLDGIKTMVATKQEMKSKTPFVALQFVVMRQNAHQLEELKSLALQLKVDALRLKTAQVYNFETGSDIIPEQAVYSRYQSTEAGSMKIKNKLLNHCWRLWHAPVLTWDGKMVPCCFDKDAEHQMGDVNDLGIDKIWKNEHYQAFRKNILNTRKSVTICQNCTEGTKVWI